MIMGERWRKGDKGPVLNQPTIQLSSGNWCIFHPTHPDLTKNWDHVDCGSCLCVPETTWRVKPKGKQTTGGGDGRNDVISNEFSLRAATYGKHGFVIV